MKKFYFTILLAIMVFQVFGQCGDNLVTNGDFELNTDWIIVDDSIIESGKFHAINSGSGGVKKYQGITEFELLKTYLIQFEVNNGIYPKHLAKITFLIRNKIAFLIEYYI